MTTLDEGPWPPEQLPAHDRLADEQDELSWDRDLHGRMVDFAAPDDAVPTAPWEG